MKKLLLITALLTSSALFASHGVSSEKCDLKYNHCMGDCSVKYGSDTECVARCKANYQNCKAGLHTEDYTAPKAADNTEAPEHEKKAHH